MNAVLGEHVTSVFTGYAVVAEHLKAGKLRALAAATLKRIAPLPDVPTFDESGFKNLKVDNWFGVIAPEKTPKEMLTQLSGWFAAAIQAPDVKAKLAVLGFGPVASTPDEFGDRIKVEIVKWAKVIKDANIKVD